MPTRRPSARAAACIARSSSYPMVSQARSRHPVNAARSQTSPEGAR